MPEHLQYQQSRQYEQFRCIGAACEDTCCDGWNVSVDRETYNKYQAYSHPVLGPQLRQWIQIQPAAADDNAFARIVLSGSTCPFLSEKLCSIQKELGEEHLGRTCATFPRVSNNVAGVVERSLDLSCPEAARLMLIDPEPASFHEFHPTSDKWPESARQPDVIHPYFWAIRSALLSLLLNRRYRVAQRLVLVGHICDKLSEVATANDERTIPELLEGFALGIDGGLYDAHLLGCAADASTQLNIILELMVARIKVDFVPNRFLDLYRDLVDGLQLMPGMSMNEAGKRYAEAYRNQYAPFLAKHEHMIEHYLVHYAYRTLFPFGSPVLNASLSLKQQHSPFTAHYMLLSAHFAIAQGVMVGMAAKHGSHFGPDQVIRCIQSCSRALEHCTSYPSHLFEILAAKGIASAAGISALTQSPEHRRGTLQRTSFSRVAGAGG